MLEKYGSVRSLRLMTLTDSNQKYAFITYTSTEEAQEAVVKVLL
jgi:hypothetical protein